MKIDKKGIYKTRNGRHAHVDMISPMLEYPVRGMLHKTDDVYSTWSREGVYNVASSIDGCFDLMEYLSIEDYPELYI